MFRSILVMRWQVETPAEAAAKRYESLTTDELLAELYTRG
jgi:hypothetical protein